MGTRELGPGHVADRSSAAAGSSSTRLRRPDASNRISAEGRDPTSARRRRTTTAPATAAGLAMRTPASQRLPTADRHLGTGPGAAQDGPVRTDHPSGPGRHESPAGTARVATRGRSHGRLDVVRSPTWRPRTHRLLHPSRWSHRPKARLRRLEGHPGPGRHPNRAPPRRQAHRRDALPRSRDPGTRRTAPVRMEQRRHAPHLPTPHRSTRPHRLRHRQCEPVRRATMTFTWLQLWLQLWLQFPSIRSSSDGLNVGVLSTKWTMTHPLEWPPYVLLTT